jgi:magnesium-transporting ATPase (P-type)
MPQSAAEAGLVFLGLAIMQNRPKMESAPTIDLLRAARMRCVMVTGDNILTACTVARECHLIGPQDRVAFATCRPDGSGRHQLQVELSDGALRIGEFLREAARLPVCLPACLPVCLCGTFAFLG